MADVPAFRIAMRTIVDGEDRWWVAFLAKIDTLEDSLELGRIRYSAIRERPDVRKAFMNAMQMVVMAVLTEQGVEAVAWQDEKPAP